jgi:predicted PurR-regulated permease PerM
VGGTARTAFVVSLIGVLVVVAARGVWALRVVLALLFLSFVFAAAIRPGVEALRRRGVPRVGGITAHYLAAAGVVTLLIWFAVPRALQQVREALGESPTETVHRAARHTGGVKGAILRGLESLLNAIPPPDDLVGPVLNAANRMFHILLGIVFVLACTAYWIFERDRAVAFLSVLVPGDRRSTVRGTWRLVEARLGAYVRAQLFMITFVSTVLSAAFWAIGLPYWFLLGIFAGVVEIIPVVGPFAAAIVSIGVGLTVSTEAAVLAAVAVYGLRLLQDYVIGPRVVGHAVSLPPLLVLVNVTAMGVLLGPALVPLATPLAAVLATLVDVLLRGRDPDEIEVPRTVLPQRR